MVIHVQTALRQLVDDRLDGNLDGLVSGLRLGGWGWRRIADEISRRTALTVSFETLRGWYPADRKAPEVANSA